MNPLTLRKSTDRGLANHGWLQSRHTFSFADYYDPAHMGFRSLRVINEDRVQGGGGFPTHPHRDMEIFSYVVSGTLAHKDSLGNSRSLTPGQIQVMSAGRGVTHSEFNPSSTDPLHFLQIWIKPHTLGLPPSYTEWHPHTSGEIDNKALVISPDGREGSATIAQDAFVYRIKLSPGETFSHDLGNERGLWLQLIHGRLSTPGISLEPGDALSTETPGNYVFSCEDSAEGLLFDLA